jgi:cobalt/nickel transport system permease protein
VHISEGVLSSPVLAAGAAVAAAGVAIGLRKLDERRLPRAAVVASAFFVASLIRVPIGPSSAHLILNGLAGIILGWVAFPAILVALLLQAVLFGYGGLTTLGVNTVTMAAPAVACYALLSGALRRAGARAVSLIGFAAGTLSVGLGCVLVATALYATGKEFALAVEALLVAHLPVLVVEGLITGSVAGFLRKVRPEVLDLRLAAPAEEGAAGA